MSQRALTALLAWMLCNSSLWDHERPRLPCPWNLWTVQQEATIQWCLAVALDSRTRTKKNLQQSSSWSSMKLFSSVKRLKTAGCGWLATGGQASYLAHWDGESLDNLLVRHSNHTLTVDLDDPVPDAHAASLGDAASHQAANLRGTGRHFSQRRHLQFACLTLNGCYPQCHSARWSPAGTWGRVSWWGPWWRGGSSRYSVSPSPGSSEPGTRSAMNLCHTSAARPNLECRRGTIHSTFTVRNPRQEWVEINFSGSCVNPVSVWWRYLMCVIEVFYDDDLKWATQCME